MSTYLQKESVETRLFNMLILVKKDTDFGMLIVQ